MRRNPIRVAGAKLLKAAELTHCKLIGHTWVGLPFGPIRCIRCGAR